ncbi:hypothetical protein CPB86DRAFT_789642, partial [Serendipita vermifera]
MKSGKIGNVVKRRYRQAPSLEVEILEYHGECRAINKLVKVVIVASGPDATNLLIPGRATACPTTKEVSFMAQAFLAQVSDFTGGIKVELATVITICVFEELGPACGAAYGSYGGGTMVATRIDTLTIGLLYRKGSEGEDKQP